MKKRLLTIAASFLCSLFAFAQFSGSGSGTESDPYLIYNETQLSQMANFLNQEGVVFSLKKDLDLSNWIAENSPTQGWQPIGVDASPFKGKLLGNGKTISGLSISRSGISYVGFFGYLSDATVSDLNIGGTLVKGGDIVGALAGKIANSTITNVSIEMSEPVSGTSDVGGLAGCATGCTFNTFSVKSDVNATQEVGGAFGSATECAFTGGSVTGNITAAEGYAGGLIGDATGCSLNHIAIIGDITADGSLGYVAGMIGNAKGETSLSNCSYQGDVRGATIVSGCVGNIRRIAHFAGYF